MWDFIFIKWTLLLFMYLYILYLLVFLLRDDSFSAGLLYCTQNFLHKIFRMGFNFGRKIFIFWLCFEFFFLFNENGNEKSERGHFVFLIEFCVEAQLCFKTKKCMPTFWFLNSSVFCTAVWLNGHAFEKVWTFANALSLVLNFYYLFFRCKGMVLTN